MSTTSIDDELADFKDAILLALVPWCILTNFIPKIVRNNRHSGPGVI